MTAFPAYPFKASPNNASQLARSTADRFDDVINVRDWGAKGDGVTDDTDAIQAAINYAYTTKDPVTGRSIKSTIVYIPPGTYVIGKGGTTFLRISYPNPGPGPGVFGADIRITGASRESTILKGSYDTGGGFTWSEPVGYLVQSLYNNVGGTIPPQTVENLTIWNTSIVAQSGALYFAAGSNTQRIINCHFKGVVGLFFAEEQIGGHVESCIAECNQATPAAGTIGIYVHQASVIACSAIGCDIGFVSSNGLDHSSGDCTALIGNRASGCNTGFALGIGPAALNIGQGICCHGNWADNCSFGFALSGINGDASGGNTGTVVAGNAVTGSAFIGIEYAGGTAVVIMANSLSANCSNKSIILFHQFHGPVGFANSVIAAMDAPNGWGQPIANNPDTNASNIDFIAISGASAPLAFLQFVQLANWEGRERNIVDGQKSGGGSATFGDIVAGGSTGRYKVRFDGANWRRNG